MQSKCRGGIWFFQIKRSTDGSQWHPHLHILIDSNYIPKLELSKTWEQSSRGSKIIDIRQIHSAKKAADYVARYAAAPCRLVDYSAEDSVTIAKALHGLRIVGKFGSAKDVQLSPQKPNDADCWEKIADYTHVVLSRHYDDKSAKIWKAWQDNSPLCVLDKPPKPSDVVPSVDVLNEAPESFRGMQTCFSY